MTNVNDLPRADQRWAVVVEETRRYVLWIDGETPDGAVEMFNEDASDPGREAMIRFDWECRVPGDMDWDWIQYPDGVGSWPGTDADAHVRTWRTMRADEEHRRRIAACTNAGHPVKAGRPTWPDYCDTCGRIEPGDRTADAEIGRVLR